MTPIVSTPKNISKSCPAFETFDWTTYLPFIFRSMWSVLILDKLQFLFLFLLTFLSRFSFFLLDIFTTSALGTYFWDLFSSWLAKKEALPWLYVGA